MQFPIYEEVGKLGDLEFVVNDLSVAFCVKAERNPNLLNTYNILKDGTNLTDEQMENLTSENIDNIIEHIYEVTNPNYKEDNEESNIPLEELVAMLITKGHTHAYSYNMRFFQTAIKVLVDGAKPKKEVNNFDMMMGLNNDKR